jgi:nucleotide-binding universal stress UspA family protein
MANGGRIVVGVDGSASSRDALRWALDEASLRQAKVEAVIAWHSPVFTYGAGMVVAPVVSPEHLAAEARSALDEAVDAAVAAAGTTVEVERVVVEGGAAANLVEHAQGAALLAVGHRGRGGFAGLLLGSVAEQCAAHAPCPVVVVREGTSEASGG